MKTPKEQLKEVEAEIKIAKGIIEEYETLLDGLKKKQWELIDKVHGISPDGEA